MDQEQRWLREYGRKRRIRALGERKRWLAGLAVSTFLRRAVGIVSIFALLMMFISIVLNWNEINWANMPKDVAVCSFALLILNGVAWLIERLLGDMANAE